MRRKSAPDGNAIDEIPKHHGGTDLSFSDGHADAGETLCYVVVEQLYSGGGDGVSGAPADDLIREDGATGGTMRSISSSCSMSMSVVDCFRRFEYTGRGSSSNSYDPIRQRSSYRRCSTVGLVFVREGGGRCGERMFSEREPC